MCRVLRRPIIVERAAWGSLWGKKFRDKYYLLRRAIVYLTDLVLRSDSAHSPMATFILLVISACSKIRVLNKFIAKALYNGNEFFFLKKSPSRFSKCT